MAVKQKEDNKIGQGIRCPSCGKEYEPEDIFLIKHVVDKDKKIVHDLWTISPSMEENYTCDSCEKPFLVALDIKYICKVKNKFTIKKNQEIKLDLE